MIPMDQEAREIRRDYLAELARNGVEAEVSVVED
jgi:hypothetical protein